jgi:hypothetical protein
MLRENRARPVAATGGRAATMVAVANRPHAHFTPCCLIVRKRNRDCNVGKLVVARPMNRIVLAMPYRNRQRVDHVSVPPAVLRYARQEGATSWLVRLDSEGKCLALPLDRVENSGWLKPSDGAAEWFVPLSRFQPVAWQDWPFVKRLVRINLDPLPQPDAHQLVLFGD